MTQGFGSRLLRPGLPLLLTAAQVAYLVVLVHRFALRMPFSDHWVILGKLATALERGDALLPVLWSQHNEHRNFVGSAADLATMRLAGGDLRIEQYAMVALAAGAGIALGLAAWRRLRGADPALAAWMVPLLALLALAPAQMETWANAVQFPVVAQNVAVIGGLWALGRSPLGGRRLALAAGCGLVASACYIHGLLYWPAALVPLLAHAGRRWKPLALGWIALTAAVWGAYFTDYTYPATHPSLALHASDLADLLVTFAGMLGNPIGAVIRPQDPWAQTVIPLLGTAGLALLGLALVRLRRQPAQRVHAWPWTGLAAYALLCAAAMAVGRHKFGFIAALSPRYITMIWPFWAATLTLLLLSLARPAAMPAAAAGGRWSGARLTAWALLGLVIAVELGSINSQVQRWTPILRDRNAATRELPDVCLGNLELIGRVGAPGEVSAYWPVLTRNHLAGESPPRLEFAPGERRPVPGVAIAPRWEVESAVAPSGRCLRIAGWAAPEPALGPAREVWLVERGVALKGAWVGPLRAHVGADYDADPQRETGWVLYVDARRLRAGVRDLDLYAVYSAAPQPVWIGKVAL